MSDIEVYKNIHIQTGASNHFIRMFLDIKGGRSKCTAEGYERDIKGFFGKGSVEEITLEEIIAVNIFTVQKYILYLEDKGYASASINRKISSLSSLYGWLMKYQDNYSGMSIIRYNPFANVKDEKPVVRNKSTEFLTEEEAKALIASIDDTTVLGLRNKAILSLAITTALRKSEMINIRIKDVKRYDEYEVIEVRRKGGKLDMVKLQPRVKELIDRYLKATDRSPEEDGERYLFIGHSTNNQNGEKLDPSTLNYMIKKAAEKCGINKKLKVHSTRHSAITMAITGGATIEKVREFAGHSSIATTNRYVHSIDKLRDNPGDGIDIF